MAVGCGMSAALVACSGSPPPQPQPALSPSVRGVDLPRFTEPWDEDFAAHITLERLTLDGGTILAPKGLELPADTHVVATTEATITCGDDPTRVRESVQDSLAAAGYEVVFDDGEVLAWLGHGMAIRLEARDGAQQLAWAPEDMLSGLVAAN